MAAGRRTEGEKEPVDDEVDPRRSSSEWIHTRTQGPNERNRLISVRKIVRFLETQNLIVRHVRESITAEQRNSNDTVVLADWNESEAETLNFRICSAVVFLSFNSKVRKRIGMST